MKKVLVLINNSIGLYKFRIDLLKELRKNNDVVVSTPDNGFLDEIRSAGCKIYVTEVDRRGLNPIKDIKLYNQYKKIIKKEKPDLVITYTIKPNIYGGFACRIKKIPYAINITGLGTAFQKDNLLQKTVTVMYRVAFKNAKVIFFENAENKDILINKKIVNDDKCYVLNGAGVNLDYYSYIEYPKQEEPIHFLFIGRVMQEKGINELFNAMRLLKNNGYNCVLDVVGIHEENYDSKIKAGEEEGWLNYHGYQEDVRPFIKDTHCFVLPSWHEGMANTNLECAASGRPLITSNIHGCKEAVIESVSGFICEPKDTHSLYEAMRRFIELEHKNKVMMGVNGRNHMEKYFDKRKVVANTINQL